MLHHMNLWPNVKERPILILAETGKAKQTGFDMCRTSSIHNPLWSYTRGFSKMIGSIPVSKCLAHDPKTPKWYQTDWSKSWIVLECFRFPALVFSAWAFCLFSPSRPWPKPHPHPGAAENASVKEINLTDDVPCGGGLFKSVASETHETQ